MKFEIPANDRLDRDFCESLDSADVLSKWRGEFVLPANVVYLDGMSLGALPKSASTHVARVVDTQWGQGLIRSWNLAGWIDSPTRLGKMIAPLLGVGADDVVVADSTSVNLYKLLVAALRLRPGRTVILTDDANFPTNVHVAQGVAAMQEDVCVKVVANEEDLGDAIDGNVAVVLLTHVDYKSSRLHDITRLTTQTHRCGALMLWDLSHSVGAMPLQLQRDQVDFAVGCGYKYLNGGPGAPAFMYVAPEHQRGLEQPITGWMGHASPFAFALAHEPADGVKRLLSGTPPIVALAALEASLRLWSQVDLNAVRAKSMALSEVFVRLVDAQRGSDLIQWASPRDRECRGSHIAMRHPEAYAVMQAMIERQVIGDFREPNLMRFGFAPLYTSFLDVWRAATTLSEVLRTAAWDTPQHRRRAPVT